MSTGRSLTATSSLDVIGFRRLGHNEGDEPSYTQPLMYARVKAHRRRAR
ncbi:MAG: hypothetical protein WKF84_26480 [Pyrinomonadaceae bacterium]